MNLDERMRDNGPFEDMAQLAQGFKFALRRGKNWETMGPESKEALELIATRLAKILVGDPNEAKHWTDIAALALLRGKALENSLEKSVAQTAQARVDLFKAQPRVIARAIDELGDT
jgi:hypothetical protein